MNNNNPVLELLKELINRQSVTPDDAGCQRLIAHRLEQAGFQTEMIQINETRNLWATHGSGAPLILFAGHTDVVPTGDVCSWRFPPFCPTIADGKLYGRGAADMKSGVAAMVVALEEMANACPNHVGTLALLLTSDEEGDGRDGTQAVLPILAQRGINIDYCIVGEPSCSAVLGDTARCGRRGSLNLALSIIGKQGHVAYPEKIVNPINMLAKIIDRLNGIKWDDGNDAFPPTSFQVSNLTAGTGAENVVPETANCKANWRYNTEHSAASLQEQVEDLVSEMLAGTPLRATFQWKQSGDPFLTQDETLRTALAEAVETQCQQKLNYDTAGGTSDARFIAKYAKATLEFGPINATIHQVDECVEVADLLPLGQIYALTIENLWAAHS